MQRELGRRWADGDVSVADEHAATAVVEDLVTMLASGLAPVTGRSVVVVCPEGDDHTLPGRIVSLLLGLNGVSARFLGGSLPARDLGAYLDRNPADFLAAARTVEVTVNEQAVRLLRAGPEARVEDPRVLRMAEEPSAWRSVAESPCPCP